MIQEDKQTDAKIMSAVLNLIRSRPEKVEVAELPDPGRKTLTTEFVGKDRSRRQIQLGVSEPNPPAYGVRLGLNLLMYIPPHGDSLKLTMLDTDNGIQFHEEASMSPIDRDEALAQITGTRQLKLHEGAQLRLSGLNNPTTRRATIADIPTINLSLL